MNNELYIGIGAIGALGIISQMGKKKSNEYNLNSINKLIFDKNRKSVEVKQEIQEVKDEIEKEEDKQNSRQFKLPSLKKSTQKKESSNDVINIIGSISTVAAACQESKKAKEAEINAVKAQSQADICKIRAVNAMQAANQKVENAEQEVDELEIQLIDLKKQLEKLKEENNKLGSKNLDSSNNSRNLDFSESSEFLNAIKKSPEQINLEKKKELAEAIINKNTMDTNEFDDTIKNSGLDPNDFSNLNSRNLNNIIKIKENAEEELKLLDLE